MQCIFSNKHFNVLPFKPHFKRKQRMYFYRLQTCAIPVTEMATPWAEYTLLLVTWRVIVFSINLWRQRRYTTLCYPIYILNAIFVLYDIIPSIRFLVKSSFLTYVVFKRHPIIECYKQYLDLVRKNSYFSRNPRGF